MALRCFLLVCLCFLLCPAAMAAGPLRYAPPPLKTPVRVMITPLANTSLIEIVSNNKVRQQSLLTPVVIELADNEDAEITLPAGNILHTAGITVLYGRNVVIKGGSLKAVSKADKSLRGLLRFVGQSGTVFLEGMVVDANNKYGLDGILVGAPAHRPERAGDVVIQNTLIKNTMSGRKGLHADAFQYYGNMRHTFMDRVSIRAQYQGLFLDPQADIKSITLNRVDLAYTDNTQNGGYLLFLRSHAQNPRKPEIKLDDVYVDTGKTGEAWAQRAAYPPQGRDGAVYKNGTLSFPLNPEITGNIKQGMPATGSYVTEKTAGLNYKSPGYAE